MTDIEHHTRCAVYRHYDSSGVLLYVGMSCNPLRRLGQHQQEKDWRCEIASVTVEWFASKEGAAEAEVTAIVAECPRYNIVHNNRPRAVQLDDERTLIDVASDEGTVFPLAHTTAEVVGALRAEVAQLRQEIFAISLQEEDDLLARKERGRLKSRAAYMREYRARRKAEQTMSPT